MSGLRVAVLGAGRVGLVTGLSLWERGHAVAFLDPDAKRIEAIAQGRSPFFEPGMGELLAQAAASPRFSAWTDVSAVLACDVALLCVPTPGDPSGAVDTRYLEQAAGSLAAVLAGVSRGASPLRTVFVRSTVVPGTTRRVVVGSLGGAVDVGFLPEFLREGTALDDARGPDRVVVGADAPCVYDVARALWGDVAPQVTTTIETAELTKYANNALLALCVSFSNELACLAERLPGVDVRDVLDGVVRDRRLSIDGRRAGLASYLEPGPGFGGSCLGKDVRALSALARRFSEPTPLLDGIGAINDAQPRRLVERVERALRGLQGRQVLVLGLAFKPQTDDVRDSIALPVVAELEARGARVACHDPLACEAFFEAMARGSRGGAPVERSAVADWGAAAEGADAVVLLAPWPDYLQTLPGLLSRRSTPLVFVDARGALRGVPWPACVKYLGVGKATEAEANDGR